MFIERGKEYSTISGSHIRVIRVIGKIKVIVADLKPPGGSFEVPYNEFQNTYTPTFQPRQAEISFPKENEGRKRKRESGKNAWGTTVTMQEPEDY